jgi:succinyl-diaminopimelate desuccinylase
MEKIEANREEAIQFLQSLVRIPTVVPPGKNYADVAKIVAKKMEKAGCMIQLVETPEEYLEKAGGQNFTPPLEGARVNVIGRLPGTDGSPTLVFNGHLDTVPVNPGWETDPFGGEVINDAVHGRGASDNKGGVCAMIMAFKALKDAGIKLKGNVLLTATVDEEIGGLPGLGYIVDAGLVKGDYGLCVDGSIGNIGITSAGRIKYKVHTYGKAAHSSTPQHGVNAIEHMAKVVLAIQEYGRELLTRQTSIPAPPHTGIDFIYPSTAVGLIQGGTKENIIPNQCTITLNRRFTPEERLEDIRREFKAVVAGALKDTPDARYEIVELNTKEAYALPMDHPMVTTLKKVAEEVTGSTIPVYGSTGGTDMSHIKRAGVPMCALGPGGPGNNVHAPDERLPILSLQKLTKICALTALEICKPS